MTPPLPPYPQAKWDGFQHHFSTRLGSIQKVSIPSFDPPWNSTHEMELSWRIANDYTLCFRSCWKSKRDKVPCEGRHVDPRFDFWRPSVGCLVQRAHRFCQRHPWRRQKSVGHDLESWFWWEKMSSKSPKIAVFKIYVDPGFEFWQTHRWLSGALELSTLLFDHEG